MQSTDRFPRGSIRSNTAAGRPSGRPAVGRCAAAALTAALLGLAGATSAQAAESPTPTAQQEAYGAGWLPYLDPADVPAVADRYVACLVDSGVAVGVDLPADRAEGPIVERLSLSPEVSRFGDESDTGRHGTAMALMMGALPNGSGTIGVSPIARIVSVSAHRPGNNGFKPGDYQEGIARCARQSDIAGRWPVAVVNLSLGSSEPPSEDDRAFVANRVGQARESRISVVASAGNRPGESVGWPGSAPGVVPVAAGGPTGALCSYASYSPGTLVGPGCGIDTAEGETPVRSENGGSSSAAAFTSAIVAALRTWRPQASPDEIEGWLRTGARTVDGRPTIDVAGAFRAAGLGGIVDRAASRRAQAQPQGGGGGQPVPPTIPGPVDPGSEVLPSGSSTPKKSKLPDVRLSRSSWSRGRVVLTIRNRPVGATVEVSAQRFRNFSSRTLRRVSVKSSRVSFRVGQRPDRIVLRFVKRGASSGSREYLYLDRRNRFR
ncbi:S8 family serine peptidase [Conexibacter sp. W3-3-2]|uniref:S8 family serine peptidase n=1 Tax=Conexibacter sp. W3-3-2 TaxID=2675227 RepID=UPI0012B8874F|nr:S8 family serine peptidase [Conexibacter sp. W3-3-2]MTD47680.1 S8 family serine peptidase [Conexibacter sp. W3-3-2]